MIHSYAPTLEAPGKNSPPWYRSYHSSYYMSQLVNNLLLSYMKTFVKIHADGLIVVNRAELLKRGAIKEVGESDSQVQLDFEKLCAFDIELFLEEILGELEGKARHHNQMLTCMGVSTNAYLERNVQVDVGLISKSAGASNWFEIVKGFLNVWEFLFLYSITESTLKSVLARGDPPAFTLIDDLNERYPGISDNLEMKHGISRLLSSEIWKIFTSIRNVYAHAHGMLSKKDWGKLQKKATSFRDAYSRSFFDRQDPSSLILETIMPRAADLFSKSRMHVDKFFFLTDEELNIFRNFAAEYVFLLSENVDDSNNSKP